MLIILRLLCLVAASVFVFYAAALQSAAQIVTVNVEVLHHAASDALFAGRGNLVDTNCFAGVQMSEQPKFSIR